VNTKSALATVAAALICLSVAWAATAPQPQGIQGLGFLPGGSNSNAFGVSADGTVVVGQGHDMLNLQQAFRWSAANGMVGLGFLAGGGGWSTATGVNADGSVVVGSANSDPSCCQQAIRWTAASRHGRSRLCAGV
jgi:probable HAF family extracellular repeat protein